MKLEVEVLIDKLSGNRYLKMTEQFYEEVFKDAFKLGLVQLYPETQEITFKEEYTDDL